MRPLLPLTLAVVSLLATPPLRAAESCHAERSGPAPHVVELFTSEGCSSCPPADRWLSTLRGRSDVVALAFHVDYWDRLGWSDRFAQAVFTARQYALQGATGATFVYTPQVLVGGRDWRGWPEALPARPTAPAPTLALSRRGDTLTATVGPLTGAGAPARLAGYWAITEDGHETAVRAGENGGRVLRHDAVTRRLQPVPAWAAATPKTLTWALPAASEHRAHAVVFVVTSDDGTRPLQALALNCPAG